MESLLQDVRYALRMMRKAPAFSVVAAATLALGIGANVAIFSYVDELWLRPLPVPQADRVVRIFTSNPSSGGEIERGLSSYPDFEDLRQSSKMLSGVALYEGRGAMLDDGVENKLVTAAVISDNFFDVLEPRPAVGHLPGAGEVQNAERMAVVLSYPFWRHQYNADPSIIGQSIIVDRQPVTVLGVLPRSFRGPESMMVRDLWIPLSTFLPLRGERDRLVKRDFRDYELFGRLAAGASLQRAAAEVSQMGAQLAGAYPATDAGRHMTLVPENQTRSSDAATTGMVLLAVAALVLLIACSNIASLLIARTEYRRQEIATRIALGASRARIIRQFLTETVILAAVGTAAALFLGNALLKTLPMLMPQMSFSVGVDAYLSWRGWLAASGLALMSVVLFGVLPAILAARMMPAGQLKQRGEGSRARPAIRSALVIVQVALSVVLVVGAGLLVRSVMNGLALDPGFNAHQKMLVVDLAPSTGSTDKDIAFVKEARRRIEQLPGVVGTTAGMRVPFGLSGGGATHKVFVPGSLGSTDDREGATINFDPVSDRFFEILGTRILQGRGIDQHDMETNSRVVVVNRQMAVRFWPHGEATGRRIRLDKIDGDEYEVIGVAEDGKYNDFQEDPLPYFFMPMQADDYGEIAMAIKTTADPGSLAAPVRKTLRDLNRNVTILDLLTLREHVGEALYSERVMAGLIATLGLLGLLLAAVGIYGLMSFLVGRRTHEIAIRLALGARRSGIFRLIIGHALILTAIGAGIGAISGVAAARLLRTLLLGVAPTDALAFGIAVGVLLLVAFVAAFTPAAIATRVDPMVALRYE